MRLQGLEAGEARHHDILNPIPQLAEKRRLLQCLLKVGIQNAGKMHALAFLGDQNVGESRENVQQKQIKYALCLFGVAEYK